MAEREGCGYVYLDAWVIGADVLLMKGANIPDRKSVV